MTLVPDPIAALRSFLLADADVAAAAGSRVYGGELPPGAVAGMPLKSALIRPAGGGLLSSGSYLDSTDIRIDLFCYGSTPAEGFALWRATHRALRNMRRNVQGVTLLHWAKESGGPNTLRQQDTEWPLTLSSWQVFWSEKEVTP